MMEDEDERGEMTCRSYHRRFINRLFFLFFKKKKKKKLSFILGICFIVISLRVTSR